MALAVLLIVLLGTVADAVAQPSVPPLDMIQGRVLRDDGAPLRGARVLVVTGSDAGEPVHSDQDGGFRVAVPDRASRLRISKAGFAPREMTPGAPHGIVEIHLTRGAALAGQVSDALGQPAPGVLVVIRPTVCVPPCRRAPETPPRPPTGAQASPRDATDNAIVAPLVTETDDRGQFRFGSLPAGRYDVTLGGRSPVFWSAGATVVLDAASAIATPLATVTLRAGEEAAVRLALASDAVADFVPQSTPARDGLSAPETGVVRGEVTRADGRPVGGAIVLLEGAGGGTVQTGRSDARGRYVLANLPPGRFRLTVFTAGLPAAELGQQRALQPGRTLVLRAGETIDDVDVELPRGHVLSGRIVDAYDEPIEHLIVQAWQQRFVDGQLVLEPAAARVHRTDDRGQYRIHGLLPGTYYVMAYDAPLDASSTRVTVAPAVSLRTASGAGRAAGRGAGRGVGGVAARDAAPSPAPAAILSPSYVPPQAPLTYYPGRPFLADAVPVRIRQGRDLAGIDFVFTPTRGTRIDGRILDASGQPVQADVTLVASRRGGGPTPPARVARSGEDGTFAFAHAPPGDYVLEGATGRMAACRAAPAHAAACSAIGGSTWEFGTTFVHVAGIDAAVAATVWLSRGSVLSGRVILEGGERWSLPPSGFTLVAIPAGSEGGAPAAIQPRAIVGGDGRFTMADLSGTVRFTAVDVPQGWYLTSVRIDGVDVADRPVVFGSLPGTRAGVEVTFSTRGAEIHGRVIDAGRRPVAHAAVLVYPTDDSRWYDGSRTMATGSGPDGHFLLTALPPGDYFLAAVAPTDDTIDDDWRNPEVLHRLTAGAARVTLGPGERAATDLRPLR